MGRNTLNAAIYDTNVVHGVWRYLMSRQNPCGKHVKELIYLVKQHGTLAEKKHHLPSIDSHLGQLTVHHRLELLCLRGTVRTLLPTCAIRRGGTWEWAQGSWDIKRQKAYSCFQISHSSPENEVGGHQACLRKPPQWYQPSVHKPPLPQAGQGNWENNHRRLD